MNATNIQTFDRDLQTKVGHALLYLAQEWPELITKNASLSSLLKYFEKYENPHDGLTSNLFIDVCETLTLMGIKFEKEKSINIYLVDVFVAPNIAIEIDGIKHFKRLSTELRPHDLLKVHNLENLGYKVIKIPYFEFRESFFTEVEKRKEYLYDKLKKSGFNQTS